MATVSENLTNLKNARVAIINKLNKVQGSSIPLTTTLAELPKYIEGGTMGIVDFDTWNITKITITEDQFLQNANCFYRIIEIPRDGFISLGMAIRGRTGIWLTINVKSKGDGDNPYNWRIASSAEGTDWWDNTGGSSSASFHSFVKKGNKIAITVSWNGPSGFSIRSYGCSLYYK